MYTQNVKPPNVGRICLASLLRGTILRAKFDVPVPVRFLNGWETGDIIQKVSDVTHFMEGYFYVRCQFISISYFLTKFGEW